jgi:two-component system, OmpR family, sensor kinase
MWDTGSARTNRLLVGLWVTSAVVNVALMYCMPRCETVPFHLVWIGLSIVYGFTRWRPVAMVAALFAVAAVTGVIMVHDAAGGWIGWEETAEVPLMSALFVIQVWHVRRRQQALADLRRLAEGDRRGAEHQQLFVRLVSHELKTPITVARGYTELLRARLAEPSVQEDTAVVLDELDRLDRITRRLVALIQQDSFSVVRPTDVDGVLAQAVHRWEPAADRRWRVRSAVGVVSVNEERLATALDCLLENAVKFTAPGDRIEVIGSATSQRWTVEVRDNGRGLSVADVAVINAADGPLPWTPSGTGLGLAIARTAVAACGGNLVIAGEPGAGAVVTLTFPIAVHDGHMTDR